MTSEIHFYCMLCGSPMKIGNEHAGALCECGKCSCLVPTPPAPGKESMRWLEMYPPDIIAVEIIFRCSECLMKLAIDARRAGNKVPCPRCGKEIRIPHLESLSGPADRRTEVFASARRSMHLSLEEIDFLNNAEADLSIK